MNSKTEKKTAKKENKIWEKAKRKNQSKDIKRLTINNIWRVVIVLKKIFFDPLTGPKALKPPTASNAFNNIILDLFAFQFIGYTPKDFCITNAKLGNNLKKKTI